MWRKERFTEAEFGGRERTIGRGWIHGDHFLKSSYKHAVFHCSGFRSILGRSGEKEYIFCIDDLEESTRKLGNSFEKTVPFNGSVTVFTVVLKYGFYNIF